MANYPGWSGQPQQQYGAPTGGYSAQQYGSQPGQYGAPGGYPGGSYPGGPPQPGYPPATMGGGFGGPPPGADPALWNWFMTVDRDRSGQITADELQQALINGNWTQFNSETCRLMIGMFDRDQSGTINFQEFANLWSYINQWKGVFDRYDTDRSGQIEKNELQNAFVQMGYNVSPPFVDLIIYKFDSHSRRSLKLDSFIQCCVMLRMLTDTFRAKDTNMNGTIQISYEEFMCMAILNKP